MPTLIRPPETLDAAVRDSAERTGVSLNSWWLTAAQEKLDRERIDLAAIASSINADRMLREVLDRLAQ